MLWQISIRYLLAHKRQSLVCIAGVTISVVMFLSMFAMMSGFRDKFIIETVETSGHVVVNDEPRESTTPILEMVFSNPNALLAVDRVKPRDQVKKIKNAQGLIEKIRSMQGITAVAPEVTGDAIASYGTKTLTIVVQGIEPDQQQRVTTIGENVIAGDFGKLRSTADGVVVGSGVAKLLGAGMGDTISLASSTGGRTSSKIVGIFETGITPTDYGRVYMLLNNAQTLLDKKNIINQLTIRTDDYLKAKGYAAQIESFAGYKTESWQEANANFLQLFAVQDAITYIITGALLVVAAFGVLNILIMAVLERINDIAILKSFGFSRRDITLLFLNQGLVIGLVGATLGMGLGKLTIMGLARLPIKMHGMITTEGLLMSESRHAYILAFAASIVVVMLASVYPARRAARYDPVEVIRGAH